MSENVLVVIDSASMDNLTYRGGSNGGWTTKSGSQWFGNTSIWSGTGSNGSIQATFTGNAIAFYGHSPPLPYSQDMTVTIDEQESYRTTFPAKHAGSYCQWWQSPTLDDGTHTIRLEGLTRTSLDFAAVTASNTSVKTRQQIIVDDADTSMTYSGQWKRHTGPFTSHRGKPAALPFHNGTHQSNATGSSVSFKFTGTSIAVYGLMPVRSTGSITARYTLDSDATTRTHKRPENPPRGNAARQNFLFYSRDLLDPGSHTLLIEIQDVQNLIYTLDYVVYTFLEAVEKINPVPESTTASAPTTSPTSSIHPSVAHTSSTSLNTTTTTTISSSTSMDTTTEMTTVAPSITPPLVPTSTLLVSESPSTTSTSPNVTPTAADARSNNIDLHTGGIVGIVIGGAVILAALIAAVLCWKRRHNRFRSLIQLQDIDKNSCAGKSAGSRSLTPIEPFTLFHPAPDSRAAIEPTDLKMASLFSLNPNPNFILQHLAGLHRRSGSGTRPEYGDSSEDTHYTLATSSSTIVVDGLGKPPSYRV